MRTLGIFDSGIGGLTVLKEILKANSYERIVYLGDTKRVPYGEKTKEELLMCAKEDMDFLLDKKVDDIVVACGTVSTNCLEDLRNIYNNNIIGIVDDVCELAVRKTKNKKIGVIGTTATISTRVFETKINEINNNCSVYSVACPEFVKIVEEDKIDDLEYVNKYINLYLESLKKENIDTLIYGCTHFPMLEKSIDAYFEEKVNLLNSGTALKEKLYKDKIQNPILEIYTTSIRGAFTKAARKIIEPPVLVDVKLTSLDKRN